ncbi:zinc ABC transporter substrate-binding protein [Arcanobacterium hippocoleae]
MKNNFSRLIAVTIAAAYALGACSTTNSSTKSGDDAEKLNVTTSFYPLTYLVKEIGGKHVEITDLTPPTGSAHDAEISPAQIAKMEKSDAVFYLANLSAAIDKAVENTAVKNAVNIGDSVNLIKQTDIAAFSESLPAVDTDSDDSREHDDHDHGNHDGNDHEDADNHNHDGHEDDHDRDISHEDDLKYDHENKRTQDHKHTDLHDDHHEGETHTGHDHADHDDADHNHNDDDDAHEHNHGIYDPHFWTDPTRLALAAPVIAKLSRKSTAPISPYTKKMQRLQLIN